MPGAIALSATTMATSVLAMAAQQPVFSSASHVGVASVNPSARTARSLTARRTFDLHAMAVQQQQQQRGRKVSCQASYTVKLITPTGEAVLNVEDNEYILDAAEDQGVDLPYSCRSGACSSCAGILKQGKVDQSNQTYLEDSQVEAGYILTCVAYPMSDMVIETHKEEGLY